MAEARADGSAAIIHRVSSAHYEQWKKADLFEIALATMPKQASPLDTVLDDLVRQNRVLADTLRPNEETS